MKRILIADDHPLYRDALLRMVQRLLGDATVHEADSYGGVLARLAADANYDLLLLDLHMPGADAYEALQHLHNRHPGVPIVIVSASDSAWDVRRVLQAGAVGYLSKAVSPDGMQASLLRVLRGELPLNGDTAFNMTATPHPPIEADPLGLTPRQRQVFALICAGEPNKLIARKLGVTAGTVKLHVGAILQALQVENRTQAVIKARALGYAALAEGSAATTQDLPSQNRD